MADDQSKPSYAEFRPYLHWLAAALITILSSLATRYLGPSTQIPPVPTIQEVRTVVQEEVKTLETRLQAGPAKNIGVKP